MRSARFHAEAESELQAEATYYEQHTKGLGERFAREVEAAVRVACSFPYIGSPYKHGTRRVYPKKLPFSVVYLVRSEEVLVLAIAPFSKRPGYWRNRRVSSNPSVERTFQRPLRALWPAAHVER